MKIRVRKRTLLLVALAVLLLLAARFLLDLTVPLSGELRCSQCGRPATHRLKAGSWIVGLCDSCYAAANGIGQTSAGSPA